MCVELAFDVFVHFSEDEQCLRLLQTRLIIFDVRKSRLAHFCPERLHRRGRFGFVLIITKPKAV